MSHIEIFIPDELEGNALQIKRFFDAMIYKLRKNAHKPSFERTDAAHCLARIRDEADELEQAIDEGNTTEILLEAADVGNFALLAATSAIERDGKGESGDHHDRFSGRITEVVDLNIDIYQLEKAGVEIKVDNEVTETILHADPLRMVPRGPFKYVDSPDGILAVPAERATGGPAAPGAVLVAEEQPAPTDGPAPPQPVAWEDLPDRAEYIGDPPPHVSDTLTAEEQQREEATRREIAKMQGYTGNACMVCNSTRMKIAGHCEICEDCGTSTGCS